MSALEDKAVDLLDKFEKLATQYTPEVVASAKGAVQVTGVGNIIGGVAALGASVLLWWLAKNFVNWTIKKKQEDGYMSSWEMGMVIGTAGGILACGITAMCGLWAIFDIWNWVAIFNPGLALAHKVLGL